MLTDKDILKSESKPIEKENSGKEDPENFAKFVLDGFDPENIALDRRILYEVTGMRLNVDDYLDEESSASDNDGEEYETTDFDYAFMQRSSVASQREALSPSSINI